MTKQIFIFIWICLMSFYLSAQNKSAVIDNYARYYKPSRENVFLHLNKSTYLIGEEIWFKGYVYDAKNDLPSKRTRNLYCAIYDSIGQQISKKLFLVQGGYADGNFSIDSSYTNGIYYVKAFTSRMKNFDDNDAFIQTIKVLDKIIPKSQNVGSGYDFQLLPEGGHMIANIENTVGFKLIDGQGKGVKFKNGKVLDQNNKEVITFVGNQWGMGKLKLNPITGHSYKALLVLNDASEVVVEFPKAEEKGVTINVDNSLDEHLKVLFKTNALTHPDIIGKAYRLGIHRDGHFKIVNVDSFKKDEYQKTLIISKKELFKGINILTIFNSKDEPILERIVFNHTKILNTKVAVSVINKTGDSIKLKMTAPPLNSNTISLSISILPIETSSYAYRSNMLSEFYLKPYLRSAIENPSYYFKNTSAKNKEDLDLLLLTQGWSKYDWKRTFKRGKKKDYEFENGISILGRVYKKSDGTVLLFGPGNTLDKVVAVDKSGSFKIKNLFLEEGGSIRFSLANRMKGVLTPPNINLQYLPKISEDILSINEAVGSSNFFLDTRIKEMETSSKSIIDQGEQLDEVVITKKLNREQDQELERPVFASSNTKRYKISKDEIGLFGYVPEFIRSLGYIVNETNAIGAIELSIRKQGTLSFLSNEANVPTIYFDGMKLNRDNLDILYKLSLEEVEEIYFDRHGSGSGFGGTAGMISIITKKRNTAVEKEPTYIEKIVTTGFTKSKKYYAPRYHNYSTNEFMKYGVIDWKPNIKITNNKAIYFQIFNTKLKELNFYIEGMDEKGNLFSDVQTINF